MKLKTKMQELIDNIKKPILFYIPKSLFQKLDKKHIDQLKAVGFLDTLFMINIHGTPVKLDNRIEQVELLKKPRVLKSNMFQLLELKSKLDKEAFHYLIEDYFKELHTWIKASEMIKNEAKMDTQNYFKAIQGYLDLQHTILQTHQEELNNRFGKWKTIVELERVFKLPFSEQILKPKIYNKSLNLKPNQQEPTETSNPDTTVKRKSKQRKIHISENDADQYLLKTVFKVDFSKINV